MRGNIIRDKLRGKDQSTKTTIISLVKKSKNGARKNRKNSSKIKQDF